MHTCEYIIDKDLNIVSTHTISDANLEMGLPSIELFSKFSNEMATIQTLKGGLFYLYKLVKRIEEHKQSQLDIDKENGIMRMGWGSDLHLHNIDQMMLENSFYWFSNSMNNLIRLIGYIKIQDIDNIDVMDSSEQNKRTIKNGVNQFRDSILQLADMIKWRNKVSGHFASTDPRADDNVATLVSSHCFPIQWDQANGGFKTGQITLSFPDENGNMISSEIPIWSLTELYEVLTERFNLNKI
jgi:hypothetical protein